MNNEEAKTYWANIRTRQELIGNNLMEVCCDYPDQIRVVIDELVSHLNDNQLDQIDDLIVNNYGEEEVIDSQELEGDISTVKDSDYAEKVDTLVDKMEMKCYTWDPDFYNEIVKDWNYRFPKFSYIEYPEFKKGI